jgi:hypothetical protein
VTAGASSGYLMQPTLEAWILLAAATATPGKLLERAGDRVETVKARATLMGALAGEVTNNARSLDDPAGCGRESEDRAGA